jgi:hypothetical protein
MRARDAVGRFAADDPFEAWRQQQRRGQSRAMDRVRGREGRTERIEALTEAVVVLAGEARERERRPGGATSDRSAGSFDGGARGTKPEETQSMDDLLRQAAGHGPAA